MPADRRPTVVQFGESLGAQVALDILPDGSHMFDQLGVDAGLYWEFRFRTDSWNTWIHHRDVYDPEGRMVAISQPEALSEIGRERVAAMRHLMVVHHDDPVNKFGYRQAVRPPWWMGARRRGPKGAPGSAGVRSRPSYSPDRPEERNTVHPRYLSPAWPRLSDRHGPAVRVAYRVECTPEQAVAIEIALRKREMDWAQRTARRPQVRGGSRQHQLHVVEVGRALKVSLPNVNLKAFDSMPNLDEPVGLTVADQDPNPDSVPSA